MLRPIDISGNRQIATFSVFLLVLFNVLDMSTIYFSILHHQCIADEKQYIIIRHIDTRYITALIPWSLSSLQTTVASCSVQLLSHTGDHTPSLLHISTSWRLLLFTSLTTVTLPSGHDEPANHTNE